MLNEETKSCFPGCGYVKRWMKLRKHLKRIKIKLREGYN